MAADEGNRMFTDEEKEFLTNKCKLERYQILSLERAKKRFDFKGKVVLEVGGSNLPRECVFDFLGAEKWVCVDLLHPYQIQRNKEHYDKCVFVNLKDAELDNKIKENDYVIIKADIADVGGKLEERFDVCLSLCSFEHMHRLNLALKNIYRSLRKKAFCLRNLGLFILVNMALIIGMMKIPISISRNRYWIISIC